MIGIAPFFTISQKRRCYSAISVVIPLRYQYIEVLWVPQKEKRKKKFFFFSLAGAGSNLQQHTEQQNLCERASERDFGEGEVVVLVFTFFLDTFPSLFFGVLVFRSQD